MNNLPILLWISLIVILNAGVNAISQDYSRLCEQCIETTTVPECSTIDALYYNRTIHCQYPVENPCILAIVEASAETNDTDIICLINKNNILSDGLTDNAIDIIATIKPEIGQTMTSQPSFVQSTTKASLLAEVESFIKPLKNETTNGKIELATEQSTEGNETPKSNRSEIAEMSDETKAFMNIANETPTETEMKNEAQMEAQEETESEVEAQEEPQGETQPEAQEEPQPELQEEPELHEETQPEVQEETQPEVQEETQPEALEEPQPEAQEEPQPEADEAADVETEDKPIDYQADTPDQTSDDAAQPAEIEGTKIDETPPEENPEESAVTEMPTETAKETINSMATNNEPTQMTTVASNVNVELKCFECISSTDVNCVVKPMKEMNCKTMENQKNGCYTLFKENKIQRGCTNELSPYDIAACLNATNKACVNCVGSSNCNSEPWPHCFNCDESNESDSQCADQQSTKDYDVMICAQYDDVCISRIDKTTGATLRDCALVDNSSKLDDDNFPAMRRHCHQCSGTDTCAAEQDAKNALPCPIYKANDACYFYVNATGQMERGCMSSDSEYEGCKASGNKCITCTFADACNSTPLMVTPNLACSNCDSRLQNTKAEAAAAAECAWAQTVDTVKACSHKYLYYLNESCQMIHHEDMEWTVRGCSMDIGACEPTMSEWCQTCSTNACNNVNLKWEYCIECNSSGSDETSSNCSLLTGDNIKPSKCGATIQSYAERGCYTSHNLDTNVTTRGCISDLAEEGLNYCKSSTKSCILCYEAGCNNVVPPQTGTATKPFISLLSIVIVVLLQALL